MQIKFISSLLVGGAAMAAAHRSSRRAFISKASTMNNVLSIRGGAGPLPVEATAKSAAAIVGIQGLVSWLAPETCLGVYEMDISEEEQGIAEHFLNLDGANLLAPSIAMFAILSHNVEPMKALGMGCLVAAITNFKNVINGSSEKLKLGKGGQVFTLALTSFLTHALLTGADYATTATKVLSAFWALAGLQCRLDPEAAGKAWGCELLTDKVKFITKILGQNLMHFAVFSWSVASGDSPIKAYGLSMIPGFLSLAAQCFIEKDEAGPPLKTFYPWVAVQALWIGTLCID